MTTMAITDLNNQAAATAVLDEYVETMHSILQGADPVATAAVRGLRSAMLAVAHKPARDLYEYADTLESFLLGDVVPGSLSDMRGDSSWRGRTTEENAVEATIHTARTLAGIREVAYGRGA